MKKAGNKISRGFKRIISIIKKPEMVILPGNIAYSLILSIFPAIIVLAFIISLFNLNGTDISNVLFLNMPGNTYELIKNFLSDEYSGLALITFFSGVFFASNGARSIIIAANTLYKTKEKNYLRTIIKSLLLVLVLMFTMMFIILILGYGSFILKQIVDYFGINDTIVYTLFNILKWPISFVIIFVITKIIYVIAPNGRIKSKSVNLGSLFTTAGWLLATFVYSIYVNNFARYDVFYGSLTSIVVLMIWVYILCYILVIGFAINASNYLDEKD